MSPFSRFSGLNIRGNANNGSNYQTASRTPKSPRSTTMELQHQHRVELLLNNPGLIAAFKKRVSETNNFSNASACFVLHEFLEDMVLPESPIPTRVVSPTNSPQSNGTNYRFGILNTLRGTMAHSPPQDPPTPTISYRSPFDCPDSPQPNLSPTQTPLTPISGTSSMDEDNVMHDDDDDDRSMDGYGRPTPRPAFPAGLEQPNF